MRTTYIITEAHSGTSKKEIQKAKRFFRTTEKFGQITEKINIRFSDINYCITASFYNEAGIEICNPAMIYDGQSE
jgi:hypothetical protein